ncbi:MAG: NUDIX domain-containing protein [Anaerolineae bacterium]|jgi:8-oxo-dGTP pyrophosphatase MutT (NUDIX family)
MNPHRIRSVAICLIEDRERLFVFEARDSETGETFYRPLGGGIEFGERGAECVARELREEIGAELEEIRYVGTIESIFTCNGEQGHEIVLVYRAQLSDLDRYRDGPVVVQEETEILPGRWIPLASFRSGEARLVPEELLDLLDRDG